MTKMLFVCHANVSRSPMAEYVMRHLISQAGLEGVHQASSAAATKYSLGVPLHFRTRQILARHGIPYGNHRSRLLTYTDARNADLVIAMDHSNVRDVLTLLGSEWEHKLRLLLDWSGHPGDVADPCGAGDYEKTFEDIWEGCSTLLAHLEEERLEASHKN